MTTEKFASILVKYAENHDTVPFSGFNEDEKHGGLNVDIDDDFITLYEMIKEPQDDLKGDLTAFISNMLLELSEDGELDIGND